MTRPKKLKTGSAKMIMARSGAERLIMGCQMFDTARSIIIASMSKDLPEDEFKLQLFERIYGAPLEKVLHTVRDGPEE
jgi:hypothetical protein